MKEKIVIIKTFVQETIATLEEVYKMSYDEMEKSYYKNDCVMDYHIGVSYVAGMEQAIKILEKK